MTSRPASFDAELLRMRPQLLAVAIKKLRDRDKAHDLVSDTLVRALSRWDQFDPTTNFTAWIYRIMWSRNVDGWRQRKLHPAGVDPSAFEQSASYEAAQIEIVAIAEIARVISEMSPDKRHVVQRCCVEEWTCDEAAGEAGVTAGLIRSRLFRARRDIREAVGS